MVRRLNQMSRQGRSKVELIQLGSAHQKFGVWTRPYFPSSTTKKEKSMRKQHVLFGVIKVSEGSERR